MPTKKRIAPLALVAALLFPGVLAGTASASANAKWQGRERVENGVVRVTNPAASLEGVHTIATRQLWQMGEEEADEVVFGDLIAVVRDRAGNTYLLDKQLAQVNVISPTGKVLGTRGRLGEGPAEFGATSGLAILADSLLCVTQSMPPRLVLMDLDGRTEGDYPLPPEFDTTMIYGSAPAEGGMALFLAEYIQREHMIAMHSFIQRVDREGRAGPVCWEMLQESDATDLKFDEKTDGPVVWAASADGRAYVSEDWDAYEIRSVDLDGGHEMVFGREYTPIPRAQWQLVLNGKHMKKKEMSPDTKLSETGRTIVQIFPRRDGTVWVLSDAGENGVTEGVLARFDVFDREGRFVRQNKVLGDDRPGRDRLFLVDEYLYVVVNGGELGGDPFFAEDGGDAAEEMEVRCFAMKPVP